MNVRSLLTISLVCALGVSCSGRFNGGGTMDSAVNSPIPASFGFQTYATDSDGDGQADTFNGQFQFNDLAAGVSVHLPITQALMADPDPITGVPTLRASGTGPNGELFSATVEDHGQPGVSPDDKLSILIFGGPTGIYTNSGTINNGNVVWLPE